MVDSSSGAFLAIQPDWEESLRNDEKAWVFYKPLNKSSDYGFVDDGKFKVTSKIGRCITVQHSNHLPVTFVAPISKFKDIHLKSIQCLDVSAGGLGVSLSADSSLLYVWETQNGIRRRALQGHVFDVYTCSFFPSGVVILSGGADMQLKIWDAVTGVCPVTLIGHTAAVMDTAIVDKGKNVISVSKDGTARLWNCAQAKCLDVLLKVEGQLYCCDLIDVAHIHSLNIGNEKPKDELEFTTENKILAVGSDKGLVFIVRVSSREIIATHFLSSPPLCLKWHNKTHLIIGLDDGRICLLNVNNLKETPQTLCHDSASSVQGITLLKDGFFIVRRDGLCQFYRLDGKSPLQLTGPDCDPIYSIAQDGNFIYTACRDKIIRKYSIQDMKI